MDNKVKPWRDGGPFIPEAFDGHSMPANLDHDGQVVLKAICPDYEVRHRVMYALTTALVVKGKITRKDVADILSAYRLPALTTDALNDIVAFLDSF